MNKKHDFFCSCLRPIPSDNGEDRAIGVRGAFWQTGQTIRIGFIGGTTTQQNRVKAAYAEWKKYVNLNFTFPTTGTTDVRISFNPGSAWSVIGTGAKNVPQNQPTMNLGFFQINAAGIDKVALHEIGHKLGGYHEQSFPSPNGYCFIWPNVIADLKRTQGWDEQTIHFNMDPIAAASVITTPLPDKKSILEYDLPGSWMCDGVAVVGGSELSETDKAFWGSIYPYSTVPTDPTTTTNVVLTPAQIEAYWQFDATVATAQQKAVAAEATAAQMRKAADDLTAQGRARLKTLLKK